MNTLNQSRVVLKNSVLYNYNYIVQKYFIAHMYSGRRLDNFQILLVFLWKLTIFLIHLENLVNTGICFFFCELSSVYLFWRLLENIDTENLLIIYNYLPVKSILHNSTMFFCPVEICKTFCPFILYQIFFYFLI